MRYFALFLLLLAAGIAGGAEGDRGRPVLTKGQINALETEVVPAYQTGSPLGLLNALQPFVKKASDDQIEAADALLATHRLPSVADLLSGARLSLVEQGALKNVPPPRGKDLLLTLAGLNERIKALLDLRKSELAFDNTDSPSTFREFEQRFWEMHVLQNLLSAGMRMSEYGSQWKLAGKRIHEQNLTDDDDDLLVTDFNTLAAELKAMSRELDERSLELRLHRLEFAVDKLTNSPILTDRFQAAFALDLDGEILQQFFRPTKQVDGAAIADQIVFRTALADPLLSARVDELIGKGRRAAGEDLLYKSRLLFTGLHWWYRGRYGIGPDGGGLLKSVAALTSPEAQFALYMPRKIPNPTAERGQGAEGVQFPRRHYQLWQCDTRSIQSASDSQSQTTQGELSVSSITHFERFY